MSGDIDAPGSDETPDIEEDVSETLDEDIAVDVDELEVESTAEINVDELVAKIDSTDADEAARKREIRQKLEALNEGRDDEFGSTYNFDIEKDL